MLNWLLRLLRDPLTHFLMAGLGLFVLFDATASEEGFADDSNTILVDERALLTFVQFRSRSFDEARARARLEALSERDLALLIDDFVREEALHREALALGLADNDYVIRRRLVQSIEFVTQSVAQAVTELEEAAVVEYFEANLDDYLVEPNITFTHVFFDNDRHSAAESGALAEAKLAELNGAGVAFSEAPQHTERFPYHVNYVERTRRFVERHFGAAMTEALFSLEPSESTWYGPYESSYGAHLVMVTRVEQGRTPTLDEVRERVEEDATQSLIREQTEAAVQEIIGSYDVRITYGSDAPGEVARR